MQTTIKRFTCALDGCPTPERAYSHEAHFVKHLISRAHRLGKRQARKIVQTQMTTALVRVDAALAVRPRVISAEQNVREKLAQINRLRDEVEAEIDVELRRMDTRSRFLTRAKRLLDL